MQHVINCLKPLDIPYKKGPGNSIIINDHDLYTQPYQIAVDDDRDVTLFYTHYLPFNGTKVRSDINEVLLNRNAECILANYERDDDGSYRIRASMSNAKFDCTHLIKVIIEIRRLVSYRARDLLDP